jgi:hypothetical protein
MADPVVRQRHLGLVWNGFGLVMWKASFWCLWGMKKCQMEKLSEMV